MSEVAERLADEIALREASLADARREHDAGELSEREFARIAARESAGLARARRDLAALADEREPGADGAAKPTRVHRRRWLAVALVAFAGAIGVVLWSAVGPRQAGNSITGSITLGHAQQIQQLLTEAEADVANGDPVTALAAYEQVLGLDAHNVVALTQAGWLEVTAGSSGHDPLLVTLGERYLARAVAVAPRDPAPRLYEAIVADSIRGDAPLARREFRVFLSLSPSPGQLAIARPFLVALGLPSP